MHLGIGGCRKTVAVWFWDLEMSFNIADPIHVRHVSNIVFYFTCRFSLVLYFYWWKQQAVLAVSLNSISFSEFEFRGLVILYLVCEKKTRYTCYKLECEDLHMLFVRKSIIFNSIRN